MAKAKAKSKSKAKPKRKPPPTRRRAKPRRKRMTTSIKSTAKPAAAKAAKEAPRQKVVEPTPPPKPLHVRRTFDASWENTPISTGDQHQTYHSVIFDNDMMLSLGGWTAMGTVCPACGKETHSDASEPEEPPVDPDPPHPEFHRDPPPKGAVD